MKRRQVLQAGLALAGSSWAAARASGSQPAPLRRGSRVAALAPGTWLDPADPMLEQLSLRCAAEGWELLRPPSLRQRWRWFAGSDRQRLGALQQAWLRGDVAALEALDHDGLLADPELRDALLIQRNADWVRQLSAMLKQGEKPLVAVGALHLVGKDGLVARLQAQGFKVTRLQ